MHRTIKHLILNLSLLSALGAVTKLAMADDPPARVARVSVVEGQVTLQEADGDEAGGNLVNWPVTAGTRITAAPGARTEFRVGSTAVRLDGDSSMEVLELDDNLLRLRLDYGSASVRIRNPEHVGGFELSTPQARVTLTEPGALRVDTERAPDTSVVTMLAGSGRVDGAGTSMSLRAGKRLEVRGDDLLTGVAQRSRFDDWVQARDRRDERSPSLRYVTADMTGYEELDQHGSWREDPDYGPLWAPRGVASDWAPYRDGRWTWLEPWGWTWVDDAPWGYAPSHYGRWVFVQSRWFWAPGRSVVRPVWAPALVGWVGGSGWNVTFRDHRAGPGVGWYPLSPRDRYVPTYRVSVEHERRLEWQHNGKLRWKEDPRRDGYRDGVTVLPREYFERRSIVNVGREPRLALAPGDVRQAQLISAPPVAPPPFGRPGRVIEARGDGRDSRDNGRERYGDGQRTVIGQPPRVMPGGTVVPQPGAAQDERRRFERAGRDDGERRNERDERGRISQPLQGLPPGQLPQQQAEQQRMERQRLETLRQDQQRQEGQRQERQRQELQQQEQQRQEALRQDQQRQEIQRQERQERQRQDSQRQDAQRQDMLRQEALRQEQQRQQETQRQDAQRQERQRQEFQQREQWQRQDQQRQEFQRQEGQRQQEAQRQDQQRQQREALRQQQAPQQQRQEARPQPQPAPAAEPRRPQREEKDNKDNGRRNQLE